MEVNHDQQKRRFFVEVEGKEAELTYSVESDNVLNFGSTFTPPELRGQGLANKVTKAALEFAKENNKKVKPSCSYVRSYVERHAEYQDLVAN